MPTKLLNELLFSNESAVYMVEKLRVQLCQVLVSKKM